MKTNYYICSLVLVVLAVVISPTTCYPRSPLPEHKERLPLVQGAPESFALEEYEKTEKDLCRGTLVSTNHRK